MQGGGLMPIDCAIGGPWEWVGDLIQQTGHEDASGSRRCYMKMFEQNETAKLADILCVPEDVVRDLRERIVEAWGEPQTTDEEVA